MKKIGIIILLLVSSCAHVINLKEMRQDVAKSVVIVRVKTDTSGWSGTGFSIGEHKILTNKHVCSAENEGIYIIIDQNGIKHNAIYVKSDEGADLCVISTEAELPALRLAKEDSKSGEHITAIGAPHGLLPAFTDGFISGYKEIAIVDTIDGRAFSVMFKAQFTSAPIYPGNSGSPCLNDDGEVAGIFFAGRGDAEHMTLIVPVNLIRQFLEEKQNIKQAW